MSTCFSVPVAADPRSPVFRNTRVYMVKTYDCHHNNVFKKTVDLQINAFLPYPPPLHQHHGSSLEEPHPTPYDSPVVIPTFKLFVA